MSTFSAADRSRLAKVAGINEAYLYQCLTGRREMGARVAVQVELATGGEIKRWHVCSKTWDQYWPELVGAEGAPPPPVVEALRA
jgi:DNA-binding transcriptional regulator YdaS (Cro superfamily)